MMAFFLVMWLINAADKKTIVQVAAYFNPMRLTDRFAAPKGLEDLTEMETKPTDQKGKKGFEKQIINDKQKQEAEQDSKENIGNAMDEAAQKSSAAMGGKSAENQKEQALFDNPGDLLEKLAEEAKGSQPATAASQADGNVSDPFDRTNRRAGKSQATLKPAPQAVPTALVKPSDAAKVLPGDAKQLSQDAVKQLPAVVPPPENKFEKPKEQDIVSKQTHATLDQTKKEDKTHDEDKTHEKDEDAKKVALDISDAIAGVSGDLPHVEVKATPEGLLISLTDDAKFGMFEVGSAKPRPELVLIMEKIGQVLQGKQGEIVVRGHTDSRAFKSGVYDNWRLSSARAQMAYYMLVRGGVDESRVAAIEGRADRDPKIPSDTLAAPNRRIDILLKEEKK
jgi:chemotaxis protein MotB